MPPAKIFWLDASHGKLHGIKRRRFFASSNMQRNISLVASASNYCRHVQTNAKNFAQRKLLQNFFAWCNSDATQCKTFSLDATQFKNFFAASRSLQIQFAVRRRLQKKCFGLTKSIQSTSVPSVMSLHLFMTFVIKLNISEQLRTFWRL